MRNSAPYRAKCIVKNRTVPVKAVKIGMRKAPAREDRPGVIRIDSVQQGDLDGVKNVFHINAVEGVTQWYVVKTEQGLT